VDRWQPGGRCQARIRCAQTGEVELHPHPGDQLAREKRLGHKICSPQLDPLDPLRNLRKTRDQENGDVAAFRARLELLQNLKSIHARHLDVQEDEVGRPRTGRSQSLLATGGRPHIIAGGTEHMAEGTQPLRVVIDYQNPRA